MTQIRSVPRRNHPVALAIFLTAYLAALALVLAPRGMFNDEAERHPAGWGFLRP